MNFNRKRLIYAIILVSTFQLAIIAALVNPTMPLGGFSVPREIFPFFLIFTIIIDAFHSIFIIWMIARKFAKIDTIYLVILLVSMFILSLSPPVLCKALAEILFLALMVFSGSIGVAYINGRKNQAKSTKSERLE